MGYRIKVQADNGTDYAGCGAIGRTVEFSIGDVSAAIAAQWDNKRVDELSFIGDKVIPRVYFPIIATER